MRDGGIAPNLAAVASPSPAGKIALRPVDGADGVEHCQGGFQAGPAADLRLGGPDPGIALQEHVRQVAPLDALFDQGDLGGTLDHHLVFDEGGQVYGRFPDHLRERRAAVAQNPRVAVGICTQRTVDPHLHEHLLKSLHRMRCVGIFKVMSDMIDHRIGFGVLGFQPGNEQAALPFGIHHKGDRPLGWNEGEPGIVQDVVAVEQHHTAQALRLQVLQQALCPGSIFFLGYLDRGLHGDIIAALWVCQVAGSSFSQVVGLSVRQRELLTTRPTDKLTKRRYDDLSNRQISSSIGPFFGVH